MFSDGHANITSLQDNRKMVIMEAGFLKEEIIQTNSENFFLVRLFMVIETPTRSNHDILIFVRDSMNIKFYLAGCCIHTCTVLLFDSSVCSHDLMVSSVIKISKILENITGTSVLIICTP